MRWQSFKELIELIKDKSEKLKEKEYRNFIFKQVRC